MCLRKQSEGASRLANTEHTGKNDRKNRNPAAENAAGFMMLFLDIVNAEGANALHAMHPAGQAATYSPTS